VKGNEKGFKNNFLEGLLGKESYKTEKKLAAELNVI